MTDPDTRTDEEVVEEIIRNDGPPRASIRVPFPLRTGRLGRHGCSCRGCATRTRAEHARRLHVARLKRRHGIPAATRPAAYVPRVRLDRIDFSGINAMFAGLGRAATEASTAAARLLANLQPQETR